MITLNASTSEQLLAQIQQISDSCHQHPDEEEAILIRDLLIQKLVLEHPLLNQIIQELLDNLRFSP